ncbi:Polyketide cyclase / dehydrase and lipid transport [Methyloligella halotolerans]|uniref:Polyketide cyclase / dehydrase and lipid transport n=1 Tax=Methyloligella halotolerans TaxID=1177755 RepID=A0A1E2S1W6_9HYPH|nr:SRPBCC family protein [Methyloligella halotolerans]ODA68329.1 Polyketide cyclase / dehydrase and lipid transport [Methyloligella halotolerans]
MPTWRSAIAVAALTAFCGSSALAADAKGRTEAPGLPDQVWALVSDFCSIKDWHPAVVECVESEKDGDTYRELTLGDGGKIVEKRTGQDDHSYSYEIVESPLPVKNYKSKIWVEKDDEPNRTVIYWTGEFDADGATDEKAEEIVTGIYKDGLAGIKDAAIAAHEKEEGIEFTPPKVHGEVGDPKQ